MMMFYQQYCSLCVAKKLAYSFSCDCSILISVSENFHYLSGEIFYFKAVYPRMVLQFITALAEIEW